ncbi:MAG: Mediator subunit Med21 [Lasallia pustulata]|uniref:Mediator of RNA polymerase II transcription subunit 21 n=1 Tax=Lasallia pustulata TaxID=136370 RepID=A0A5M8PKS1_9LECA|nr:MAG: Mediator subunit Med21 [Lasallia pustulata]
MADRLTQLQDCFDQLATQFYASLRYISTHHPPSTSNNQPAAPAAPDPNSQDPNPPRPDSPSTFAAAQRELAHDLVLKEQQNEYLISVLPGIGTSEKEQEERIRVLERSCGRRGQQACGRRRRVWSGWMR